MAIRPIVQEAPRNARGHRRPSHPFSIIVRPWQIMPNFIAPVLPGETMRKLTHLSRTVSDPLSSKFIGWHLEQSYFYVRHTDLPIASDLIEMHLAGVPIEASGDPDPATFYSGRGVNFVKLCRDEVVKWYFRDEEPHANIPVIYGQPAAKINALGWWQSSRLEDNLTDIIRDRLPGDNPQIPDTAPPGFTDHYTQWERMVSSGLTDASFEDYLASFGVRAPKNLDEEEKRPELLRHVRQWTYPTNTVEPSTGVPTSAAVWSSEFTANKDRFFKEPGFVVGYQVARPKVNLMNIAGSVSSHLTDAFAWLPALVQDMGFASLREFVFDQGPLDEQFDFTDDYWIDLKDLYLHGEQFRNHAAPGGQVALPLFVDGGTGADKDWLNHEYADTNDVNGLFADPAKNYIRTDGVVTLDIASSVHKDTSK